MPTTPPPERPSGPLEYLLIAGTSLLFLLYLPLIAVAPRLASMDLHDVHLMWLLPLLMMCACLVGLCNWALQGPTTMGRILWTLAFGLAMVGCPMGYMAWMTMEAGTMGTP